MNIDDSVDWNVDRDASAEGGTGDNGRLDSDVGYEVIYGDG